MKAIGVVVITESTVTFPLPGHCSILLEKLYTEYFNLIPIKPKNYLYNLPTQNQLDQLKLIGKLLLCVIEKPYLFIL